MKNANKYLLGSKVKTTSVIYTSDDQIIPIGTEGEISDLISDDRWYVTCVFGKICMDIDSFELQLTPQRIAN